jgi:NhaP-type Na+/H+ or K+/H+ antiporter
MYGPVAVLALIVFCYSVIADRLDRTVFGGAIAFTAIGLALGASGLGVLQLSLNIDALGLLAELTLALLLFIDAANADLRELVRSAKLPRRLLLIGLPLTIVLGVLTGSMLFDTLTLVEIALLATVLAPTDAALGKAVVSDENVPNRIRTSLNFESGLNDGICVPIFLAFLVFATNAAGESGFTEIAIHLIVEEVGIGAVVGLAIAALGAGAIRVREGHEAISPTWRQLLVPALALACFTTAQALGGSGFIAAFVGGLLFGSLARENTHGYLLAAEGTSEAVALLTWVVFGATVVARVAENATWEMFLYAFLSLTLVRMLPVWLALRGTGTRLDEVLFMGWFGPRGLASIVFAIMVIEAGIPGADLIAVTVACAILLSVLGHGLSAKPLARVLSARLAAEAPPTGGDGQTEGKGAQEQ